MSDSDVIDITKHIVKNRVKLWVTSMPDGDLGWRPMLMNPYRETEFCALGEHMSKEQSDMVTSSIIDILGDMIDGEC